MQFTDQDLRAAVTAGALDADRLNPLLDFLSARATSSPVAPAPRFDLAHLLWYAGALIVMGAMGLFSTLAFSAMGGWALTATALAYAAAFTAAGHYLWHHRNLRVPGGLLIAVAVSMAPLAVYGIQDAMGLWGNFGRPGTVRDFYVWIKGSWVWMEVAAIVAAVIALWRYPYPFIVLIIAFALWFMSMDLTPWIVGRTDFTWDERRIVSLWFGLAVLVVAYVVDRRERGGDFAFWLQGTCPTRARTGTSAYCACCTDDRNSSRRAAGARAAAGHAAVAAANARRQPDDQRRGRRIRRAVAGH